MALEKSNRLALAASPYMGLVLNFSTASRCLSLSVPVCVFKTMQLDFDEVLLMDIMIQDEGL
jgi:hypothetical protein